MNLSDTQHHKCQTRLITHRQFTSPPTTVFSIQNVIIVFLLMIILLPALGISTDSLGKIIQQLVVVITGIISWVVSSIAFLTGTC
jgi:hypothetical protein